MLVLVLAAVLAMYARPVLGVADSMQDAKLEDQRLDDVQREHRRLQKRLEQLKGGNEKSKKSGTETDDVDAASRPESTVTGQEPVPSPDEAASQESGAVAPEAAAEPVAPEATAEPVAPEPPAQEESGPAPIEAPVPPSGGQGGSGGGASGGVNPGA